MGVTLLFHTIFVALLGAAVVCDVRRRRVPNAVTGSLAATGLLATALHIDSVAQPGTAAAALAVGLAVWLPFYALRMLGAGDVKLFAAGSAWLTPSASLRAAALAALLGGVLGIIWMWRARGGAFTAVRLQHAVRQPGILRQPLPAATGSRDPRLPYAIPMALALGVEAWRLHAIALGL
jgi:prepilin peptidase CpaA